MSKQLYEEALADVKKLKEIAEDNAKKALIEAVSPRIKDLIEAELLREAGEMEDDLLLDEEPPVLDIAATSVPTALDPAVVPAISPPDEEGKVTLDLDALSVQPSGAEFELSNESIKLINPLVNKLNSAMALQVESRLFRLNEAVQKFLGASTSLKKTASYQLQILEMVSEIEETYEYLQESAKNLQDKGIYEGKLEDLYKKLNKLVEQYNMKKNLKSLTEAEITLKLTNVPDEVKDSLDDLGVDLVADEAEAGEEGGEEGDESGESDLDLGGDDEGSESDDEAEDSDEGDDELDLGGDEEDSDEESTEEGQQMETRRLNNNLVVEIDENMLRREIARMRSLREADETKPQSWGNGPGDVSSEEDFESDDLGDPFLDIELSETQNLQTEDDGDEGWWKLGISQGHITPDQAKKMKGMMGEVDEMATEMEQTYGMEELDQVYEVEVAQQQDMDEDDQEDKAAKQETQQVQEARRRLAHEARLQTEAKKKAQAAKKQQKEAQQKAKQKQQEAQQKMKQKKQQEAQKAKQEAQKQAKQAKKMQEAYVYYATKFNESVRRTAKLQSVLAESRNVARRNGATTRSTAETSTLRTKLAETNLFNTKLLYCNKLLQNESLTKRQKAEIIERLDEASSEREVKLVYESLVKTLVGSSRSMNEGTRRAVIGSSSQATRPASTVLSEGYEAERWARLAGLK